MKKLRDMDTIDNGDEWAYEDDDFDYNKKLESEDEDAAPEQLAERPVMSDPNWADQMGGVPQGPVKPASAQSFNFYEEEEKRRNKKSEEVMKNIERARQRREEEEARYRQRQPDSERDREPVNNSYIDNYSGSRSGRQDSGGGR